MTSKILLVLVALAYNALASCVGVTDTTPIQGNGSVTNPFYICNVPQFNSIGTYFQQSKHWALGSNLYFTVPLNPIGDYSVPFDGVFNGNGFEIRHYNLGRGTRVDDAVQNIGLFKAVDNATIYNIVINDVIITGTDQHITGALVGHGRNSNFHHIYAKINMQTPESATGGLFGFLVSCNLNNIVVKTPAAQIGFGNDGVSMMVSSCDTCNISNVTIVGFSSYNYPPYTLGSLSAIGILAGTMMNSLVNNVDIVFDQYYPPFEDYPNGVAGLVGWSVSTHYTDINVIGAIYFGGRPIRNNVGDNVLQAGLLFGSSIGDVLVNCNAIVL